ncbi:hypothetical protein CLPU_1c00670 [Gottschalkia purinilytica]|uniref:Uncharacterized protein n=1 Tax=Gottschalkia purinilytica TaxID=1503 RepID=A0A0L0WEJ6_GOTPU|nr:hypothetical protein [Gottschalkia purinilytica]KNF09902.1 hypothetical protein CLPU_1c00670 [Gottschalkia purinilytica]
MQRIKVNLELIEAMLYFWQSTSEKEKVSEKYINDVTNMEGFTYVYDSEFNAESVRRALSAVTNRELFSSNNKKEGRFWNNNLWMMEDLEYTDLMVQPLKKLNLDVIVDRVKDLEESSRYDEIEVIFSPLHLEEYYIVENKLIINFFRVKPSFEDDNTYIGDLEITDYIETKIRELLKK